MVACQDVIVVAVGSLQITSFPAGALIYLAPHGQTPLTTGIYTDNSVPNLAVGNYDIRITKGGYQDGFLYDVSITANNETTQSISLVLSTGSLNISSTPVGAVGAAIYIDGNVTSSGVTPLIVTGFTPGTHTYRLTKTGYTEITATNFTITSGQTTTVSQAMLTVADIRAYDMTISPDSPCIQGSCVVTVTVTWKNNGQTTGLYTPSIVVDGVPPGTIDESPYTSENLAGGATSTSKVFTISGLTAGTHSICPTLNT